MNDDLLILYYYNDGLSGAQRARVTEALAADSALRERYDALTGELRAIAALDPGPVPLPVPATADAIARWHDSIDHAANVQPDAGPRPGWLFHLPSFARGTLAAAVLVSGIGIGYFLAGNDLPQAIVDPGTALVDTAPRLEASGAFTRGLKVHFQRSQDSLSSLTLDTPAEREELIADIVRQNRLFARAARNNDAPDLARVLRAFEPILLRLADDDVAPVEAEQLRAQLQFELNVMLTKLERAPSKESNSRPQSL